MQILINWLISAVIILVLAYIVPGVRVDNFLVALAVALVIGLINALITPFILVLTLPINVLTLGLFTFVVNALVIMLADYLIPGFEVGNFWWALLFGLLLFIVNSVVRTEKMT